MRVTSGMTADNALYNLQQGRVRLDVIQEQVASGMQVNRPSDDPLSARQLMELSNKYNEGEQYLSNVQKGITSLSLTSTALDGMSSMISLAQKVAGSIPSGSSDQTVRQAAASQLSELRNQLIDIGNTQIGDQYIFGGFKSTDPPFDRPTGDFNGTDDSINIEINKGAALATNVSGNAALKGTGSYGTTDVLATFDALVTAINNNDVAGITAASKGLDAASAQLWNASSDVRARLTRLDNAKQMITNNQSTLSTVIGNKQNVDMTKAALELSQQQTAFQAALSTTAKISQLSLLDYL